MISPYFVADIETLKSALRLTGTNYCEDIQALIDQALLSARLKMFREVGDTRMAELLAITYVDNPQTAAELSRASANLLEIECVYCELLIKLPVMFQDAGGSQHQNWNDVGAFRGTDQEDREALLVKCQTAIAQYLEDVVPNEDINEDLRIYSSPSDCNAAPGKSVFPGRSPFGGRFV